MVGEHKMKFRKYRVVARTSRHTLNKKFSSGFRAMKFYKFLQDDPGIRCIWIYKDCENERPICLYYYERMGLRNE